MSMGSLSDSDDDFNPEINTTPLVDVMLVLLIIFIMTIPVMNHAVKIDLPRATNQPDQVKPESISLSIDAAGKVYWNDEIVDRNALQLKIAAAAKKEPQPELHLRAERTTEYEKIAQVMAAAQSGGLGKIGFVTDPESK
ncbi:biopolymer transporter ExbD [Glaciimonas sp. CA11.2]|uniref:ExbD/TolR family protein n=1 Tax=unclassified Glaciimonas TaxID=2644401 RepID=UPI002AB52D20|nr:MULTISPECIES: biopolymer transporter ExbD [unclassified Glaciimonas]MDY7545613.1 biopolymer transporter ExbD [Glaciimonas sp. CA11.2]MEB0012701.1 biopolymer transporter ExbD [Glaciimonas sp. Cout2]MEB0082180.1 biopolymer transporter ExbD [Glaciimonas sp. Gout2]MEB0164031.1 biopolymer transporter ExbD [Glaciimonas sp. CA11.2]